MVPTREEEEEEEYIKGVVVLRVDRRSTDDDESGTAEEGSPIVIVLPVGRIILVGDDRGRSPSKSRFFQISTVNVFVSQTGQIAKKKSDYDAPPIDDG